MEAHVGPKAILSELEKFEARLVDAEDKPSMLPEVISKLTGLRDTLRTTAGKISGTREGSLDTLEAEVAILEKQSLEELRVGKNMINRCMMANARHTEQKRQLYMQERHLLTKAIVALSGVDSVAWVYIVCVALFGCLCTGIATSIDRCAHSQLRVYTCIYIYI